MQCKKNEKKKLGHDKMFNEGDIVRTPFTPEKDRAVTHVRDGGFGIRYCVEDSPWEWKEEDLKLIRKKE